MSRVHIEMIIDGNAAFQETVDFEIAQLMMQSDYITVSMTTIRVYAKEVTSKGIVKFYGVRRKPDELNH